MVLQDGGDDEVEELLVSKRQGIEFFFMKTYEELSRQPFSIHFYLSFSKELIKAAEDHYAQMEDCIDILGKTLKNIRDGDIELFLHFNPEVAL